MAINAILGDLTQNSYVTEDEADAYFEDRAFSSNWDNVAAEDKEPLLILCSRTIDWYVKWKGFKKSATQPMEWPRTKVILRDGTEVADNVLPEAVKIAVFEMVLSSISKDPTLADPLMGLEELKVATLALRAKPDQSGKRTTSKSVIPEKVLKILTDLRSSSSFGVVRLIRG